MAGGKGHGRLGEGRNAWQAFMCGRVACMVGRGGGMCGRRRGMRGRRNGHCSGQYAYYWNAFFLKNYPFG